MKSTILAFSLGVLGALDLPAQRGGFFPTALGAGCRGTGSNVCEGANQRGGRLLGALAGSTFAIRGATTNPTTITGVELFTRSNNGITIFVPVFLYSSTSAGAPFRSVARAEMRITTTAGWHRATFSRGLPFSAGVRFFIVFGGNRNMFVPNVSGGVIGTHFIQGPGGWNGPFRNSPWAWRLNCSPNSGGIPWLTGSGTPRTGGSFSILVSSAPPQARTVLVIGLSRFRLGPLRLPFDMAPLGAPGCRLRCSAEIVLPNRANLNGQTSYTLAFPRGLGGATFHTQLAVLDPGANRLGLTVSSGGTIVLGR